MLAECMESGATKNLLFVPVSITYDQIIEEYKNELHGEAKRPERTRDLLRLGRHLKRRYGKIYVRFGDSIPYENDIKKLVSLIAVTINKGIVATPASVVATSLLASAKRGITHDDIISNVAELTKYLKWKGVSLSSTILNDETSYIDEAMQKFTSLGFIQRHEKFEPHFYEITEGARLQLDYYKNNIIHFFISASSVATIIISHLKRNGCFPSPDQLQEFFLFCKDLFQYEFAFSTRLGTSEHIQKVLTYFETESILTNPGRLEIYKGLLDNFFEAYLTTLNAVTSIQDVEEHALLKMVLKYARHLHLLGMVTREEAQSTSIIKNAIAYLVNKGLLASSEDRRSKRTYSWTGHNDDAQKLKLKLEELC